MGKTRAPYSEEEKEVALKRILEDGERISVVSRELGISAPTLRQWRDHFLETQKNTNQTVGGAGSLGPDQKLRIIAEYEPMTDDERGSFLRKNGLYDANVQKWRKTCLDALEGKSASPADEKTMAELKEARKQIMILTAESNSLQAVVNERNKVIAELNSIILLQKKTLNLAVAREG